MSAIVRQPSARATPPAAPRAAFLFRWTLGHPEPRTLELAVSCGPTTAEAHFTSAAGREPIDLRALAPAALDHAPSNCWSHDPDTALDHLDIPGLLHASFRTLTPASAAALHETPTGPRPAGTPLRVLYARTTLFQLLGIPGGRYEFLSAERLAPARPAPDEPLA